MARQVWDQERTGGVPVKIWTDKVDELTTTQIVQAARLPFAYHHIALMPDAHGGYGVPVGCVLATDGYVIPNAVGADIGCGVCAFATGLQREDFDLDKLMRKIMLLVPTGTNRRDGKVEANLGYTDGFRDNDANNFVERFRDLADYDRLVNSFAGNSFFGMAETVIMQLGTLGGGNHFIEIQEDEDGFIWIMIHSGSRALGAKTANFYHEKAKELCSLYHSKLDTMDLAFFPMNSPEGRNYWDAMNLCQDYARANRFAMMRACISAIGEQLSIESAIDDVINIHHNYACYENHFGRDVVVHRKGATQVREGVTGIIPGSMTTHSYIVKGKGWTDSFNSCSHGSGRPFSRTESKKRVEAGIDPSQADQLDKAGVKLYGATKATDELGSSYKDIDVVLAYQTDMVEILHRLKPLAVLKG